MTTKDKKSIRVAYGLSVHDWEEERAVARVIREHRTILGPETRLFEEKVAKLFGKKCGVMVNSGSSANLLALEILNLPAGSEVITPILTFNTTVSPIVKLGLKPVFVDAKPDTYLIDTDQIEKKITKKTGALIIPSLIGNVPDMARLRAIADKHHLYFIEDSCDTLGATFNNQPTGKYSDISTTSFYGSHVINAAGGGGMLCVNNPDWRDRLLVLRGWGRTSALFADSEDVEKRFTTTLSNIPYDGKFIFTEWGYNFLPLEISAAFGLVQLKKLPAFTRIRRKNFADLYKFFSQWPEWFYLPKQMAKVRTNWLAFPLRLASSSPFSRLELVKFLEKNNIQTRPVFTGNILRQPVFQSKKAVPDTYPVVDEVMKNALLIGCHQGLNQKHLQHVKRTFNQFLKRYA